MTWLVDERAFAPDRIFDAMEALDLFPKDALISSSVLFCHFDNETFEYALKVARVLGASHVTVELPKSAEQSKRLGAIADRHKIAVAYHGHHFAVFLFCARRNRHAEGALMTVRQVRSKLAREIAQAEQLEDVVRRVVEDRDARAVLDAGRMSEADYRAAYHRFADAGDFTFYFVGRFDPDSLRPLVERYLASLPSTESSETFRDVGIRPPAGVVRRTVRRGVEPKARTVLVFTGPAEFSRQASADVSALAEALEIRLREKLREDLGGTYGVSVGGGVSRDPYPRYTFNIDFGSAPERVDELVRVVMAEIDTVRAAGVPQDVVDKVREAFRRSRETEMRENSTWLVRLMSYDRHGWDTRGINENLAASRISVERVREAARLYLDPARRVQVSLVPEPGAAPAGGAPAP